MDEHTEANVDDDELIARLKAAADLLDPVPPDVVAGALAAFSWRDLDAELELLLMEQSDDGALAGVRSMAVGQFFTLGCETLVVELEVFPSADGGLALHGLALLAPVSRVEMRRSDGTDALMTSVEGGGRFSFDAVEPGPLKLVFHDDEGPRFASEWLTF
jgi:hypothetical protein